MMNVKNMEQVNEGVLAQSANGESQVINQFKTRLGHFPVDVIIRTATKEDCGYHGGFENPCVVDFNIRLRLAGGCPNYHVSYLYYKTITDKNRIMGELKNYLFENFTTILRLAYDIEDNDEGYERLYKMSRMKYHWMHIIDDELTYENKVIENVCGKRYYFLNRLAGGSSLVSTFYNNRYQYNIMFSYDNKHMHIDVYEIPEDKYKSFDLVINRLDRDTLSMLSWYYKTIGIRTIEIESHFDNINFGIGIGSNITWEEIFDKDGNMIMEGECHDKISEYDDNDEYLISKVEDFIHYADNHIEACAYYEAE